MRQKSQVGSSFIYPVGPRSDQKSNPKSLVFESLHDAQDNQTSEGTQKTMISGSTVRATRAQQEAREVQKGARKAQQVRKNLGIHEQKVSVPEAVFQALNTRKAPLQDHKRQQPLQEGRIIREMAKFIRESKAQQAQHPIPGHKKGQEAPPCPKNKPKRALPGGEAVRHNHQTIRHP